MAAADRVRALIDAPELLAAAVPGDLRTAERLRATWPAELVAAATGQAELRERARAKFARAGQMLFTRAGLEQATADAVARHRAARFAGVTGLVLDLCCGIGGDTAAIASAAPGADVVGIDRDETHALLARHNAGVHDAPARTVVADVRDVRVEPATAVFVDPARRSAGGAGPDRRGGYLPPLDWCLALPVDRVCVKAAPGLDRAGVPDRWEVEFVAHGRDLKEAVLWSPAWSPAWASGGACATVLLGDPAGDGVSAHTLHADPSTPPAPVRPPGAHLLDPSPAVTRAGAVADLAAMLGAAQIDPRIAFLTADHPLSSPFGRSLVIEASLPFGVKALAAELRRLDIGSADIRRRGLAGDVDDLRRRLRPHGSRHGVVVLTRVVNRPWAFVCTEPAEP